MQLAAGDYRLSLAPSRGGSISSFEWRTLALFRPTCGPSILDTACFPLVPFSNRIAWSRFYDGDRAIRLTPNFPNSDHPHVLHGFGWLASWSVIEQNASYVHLRHEQVASDWPWPYVAEQHLYLSESGLRHELSLMNLGSTQMPAGLGVHPYLPRDAATFYLGRHRTEWQTGVDGLPVRRERVGVAKDWWNALPVDHRLVDTFYQDRDGPLLIRWNDRGVALSMAPSPELDFTHVYVPPERDFFCVEPVSHATDAVNIRLPDVGARMLAPGEMFRACVRYQAHALSAYVPDDHRPDRAGHY